jgi:hypothetical protein
MRLIGSRGEAQPWMAVVHDHLVLAALLVGGQHGTTAHRTARHQLVGIHRGAARALLDPAQLTAAVNQPAGMAVSSGSAWSATPIRSSRTHPASAWRRWGGVARLAAGVCTSCSHLSPRTPSGRRWRLVIERIGDVAASTQVQATKRRWRRSPTERW